MTEIAIDQNTTVPTGVIETLERMRLAWDAGDAAAYAAEFTDDASYVIFIGTVSTGRARIEEDHIPLFSTWQRGSRMSMRILSATPLSDDVVVVVTEGGIGKGRHIAHDKAQTFVFVRESDQWRCAAFQNTKKNRFFAAVNARESARLARKRRAA
ncbi:hypothetical protein GCM10025768_08690 [Microbacterium pseudoresistens]|uniref:Uncharacterized protein (TIGR02246 family) n=1 Tax=Microbacterium pseudoresistens TaxID=640634 RepID=A0A7Y9EXB4_9MICO|nr:SgcJ/EcaC family oxidoreductase [Microbacterium pseudoresistens]NYD54770.1 uncharacterized protein (TIGR02246 family) [Microbacterium pseudoresistens]